MAKYKNGRKQKPKIGKVKKFATAFKKPIHQAEQEKSKALRKRGSFTLLTAPNPKAVQCPHGPCLFFGQSENGQIVRRFFTCAVYRENPEKCSFRAEADEHGNLVNEQNSTIKKEKRKLPYNNVNKKLREIPKGKKIVWCKECQSVFQESHEHPDCQFVKRGLLKMPSKLLESLNDPKGEAQFFFSTESAEILKQTILSTATDSILFIGCPSLMETFRLEKSDKNLFLLDIDQRYAPFYKKSEFAHYSLLTHHFYDPLSKKRFTEFLQSAGRLLVLCDPPFAVLVEPMIRSLDLIKEEFTNLSSSSSPEKSFICILTLPLYVGKRVLHSYKDFSMHDYRVTYSNHKAFSKPHRTSVRLFTNLPLEKLNLEGKEGYKFCEFCEYWVHSSNKHCFMCMKCTSKDGSTYKHCDPCMRCVKQSYKHCRSCERCHLPGRCSQTDHKSTTIEDFDDGEESEEHYVDIDE